jgi:hypothetical protein
MLRLIEREFNYIGIVNYCFEYRKDTDWGQAIINVFDDDYIIGYRQYKGKRTDSYLLSSIAHLLSFIVESPDQWEVSQDYAVHDGLNTTQLRKLLLNAPVAVTKSLKTHPQYDVVMRQLASLTDKHKRFDEVALLIADIQKLITTDPYRAYGEALRLNEKTDTIETQQLLDECHTAKVGWSKLIDRAIYKGQEATRNEVDDETYERISKALRWTSQKQGTEKPQLKEIRLMTCDGANLDTRIRDSRVKKLQSVYGNVMDVESLQAIVEYCDANEKEIDLTIPLEDQFDVS